MSRGRREHGGAKSEVAPSDAAATVPAVARVPVVGIGASAGGLAAFEAFFSAIPRDSTTGMAFVLVQHLAPDHQSHLGEIIGTHTSMPVCDVTDGMPVEADHVYVIPPGHDLVLRDRKLWLCEPLAVRGHGLPIDRFFRSLAVVQRERAIGIVLSGSASDGALGVRAIRAEGGMAIAQTPATAEFASMPESAIATGAIDYVLTPAEMPAQLLTYAAHAYRRPVRASSDASVEMPELTQAVCAALREYSGHDFSGYKPTTIARRVERRMALHQCANPEDYVSRLGSDAREAEALFHDLLIGVTSFFRDHEAFELLATEVVPELVASRRDGKPIRVWCCGCSTGEEAYSLAIVFHEHLAQVGSRRPLQVFASDLDRRAIAQARTGVFSESIAAEVSAERLARYFIHEPERGVYVVQRSLRDLLVFSEHDAVQDPPFSRVDFVACRNLLIYLGAPLQRRLLSLFHYALVPGGVLFLGSSESVGDSNASFATIDRKWKLYRRQASSAGRVPASRVELGRPGTQTHQPALARRAARAITAAPDLRQVVERGLLAHFDSVAVLTGARGEVLHVHGRTGKFLELPAGDVATNVLAMARDGLRQELSLALHRAAAKHEVVRSPALRIRSNGGHVTADLTVRPLDAAAGEASQPLFLVILQEIETPATAAPSLGGVLAPVPADAQGRIAGLEAQLEAKDEFLQTALEEAESANEELKATNEELQSVNEELQSTNEELETSKEELQAVNEEQITVNAELHVRVTDLSRANNDMNNLLAGTGVATLFVDLQSRIARFTPDSVQLVNLIPSDVGRPVEHVVSNFVGYDGMAEDVRAVLDRLTPIERQVETRAGAWFLMRVRPYRTLENAIEGAVVTFVDITARKRAEDELRRSRDSSSADLDAMTRLQRVGTLCVGALTLPQVLDEVLEAAVAISGASKCSIELLDPASGELATAAQRGFAAEWMAQWSSAVGAHDPIRRALETRERIVIEDVAGPTQAGDTEAASAYGAAGVRTLQATPLVGRAGALVGVLATFYEVQHAFDPRDLRLLDLLARQVTDIIERWRSDEALSLLRQMETTSRGSMGHGEHA